MPRADATWSLVASDATSATMGGAVASCVGDIDLLHLMHVSPNAGFVISQAVGNQHSGAFAARALSRSSPSVVLAAVTSPVWDYRFRTRQFGIATVFGEVAAYTGAHTQSWSGDRAGAWSSGVFAVQGNALTSESVVADAERAMASATACDLTERLLIALESGAMAGGDARCMSESGIAADSAALLVVDWSGSEVARLSVTSSGSRGALAELRDAFEAWRSANPCR